MASSFAAKPSFPDAYSMLQTMDPHALGGNPPLIELYDLQNDPGQLRNLAMIPPRSRISIV
jgi:hypothetical protein